MQRVVLMALAVTLASGGSGLPVHAQAAPGAEAERSGYRFSGTKGLLVFHVHADRVGDFEDVVSHIARGLATTMDPVRRQQAAGWRVFRSADAAASAVYVVSFDPVVPGTDYDPVKMLTELAPDAAQSLYERLKAAVIRVERLDLRQISPEP